MYAGLIFALLVAVAVFGWTLDRALTQVRDVKRRFQALLAKRQAQVDRIKKAALETLYLKRERRHMRLTRDELSVDCEKMDAAIREVSRPENRIFVLDERRTPADQVWEVQITAPTAATGRNAPAWSGARRFHVWALDEDTARTKAYRKFPEGQGYRVTAVQQRRPKAAAATTAKAAVT